MKIYVDNKPENCNNCIFKQIMSQHWDLEDTRKGVMADAV